MSFAVASRFRVSQLVQWILVSALFVLFASSLLAQLPTATILGVVKDSSGAVVPGATLTARNAGTGQTRTAEIGRASCRERV